MLISSIYLIAFYNFLVNRIVNVTRWLKKKKHVHSIKMSDCLIIFKLNKVNNWGPSFEFSWSSELKRRIPCSFRLRTENNVYRGWKSLPFRKIYFQWPRSHFLLFLGDSLINENITARWVFRMTYALGWLIVGLIREISDKGRDVCPSDGKLIKLVATSREKLYQSTLFNY